MFPTREVLYAIIGLGVLGKKPEGSVISLVEISEEAGYIGDGNKRLSPVYLIKIFRPLVRAGILNSHRGGRGQGGFSLARRLEEVPVIEILRLCRTIAPPKTGDQSNQMSKTSESIRKDLETFFTEKTVADYTQT